MCLVYSSIYKTINRIEIVIGSTKTIDMERTYKTIKWVLKQQIEAGTKTFWTWNKGKNEEFNCIYKNYNDNLTIYTPNQLLKEIEDDN